MLTLPAPTALLNARWRWVPDAENLPVCLVSEAAALCQLNPSHKTCATCLPCRHWPKCLLSASQNVWYILQMLPMVRLFADELFLFPLLKGTKNKTQQIQSKFQSFDSHWRHRFVFNGCCLGWKPSLSSTLSLHIERKGCLNQLLRSCWGHWDRARHDISLQTAATSPEDKWWEQNDCLC